MRKSFIDPQMIVLLTIQFNNMFLATIKSKPRPIRYQVTDKLMTMAL